VWPKTITSVMAGFMVFGRSFAYLGVPPAKLFVAELLLGGFVLYRPREVIDRWVRAILYGSTLSGVSIALLAFLSYGVFLFARAISNEYSAVLALQSLVFHCYPFYLFLGLWAGMQRPELLWKAIPVIAWVHAVYGLAYVTVLDAAWIALPGTDVNIFGQPNGGAFSILGLLCLPKRTKSHWGALALNAGLLLGLQVRADWLAISAALALWGLLQRRIVHLAFGAAALMLLLLIASVTGVSLPGPADRGGDVSAEKLLARIIAPVDLESARELDSQAGVYKGTTTWRTTWWDAIWGAVHSDVETTVFGFGYGYPLGDLVPYLRNTALRTPHNVFFYALGYGGWAGVTVFLWLQTQIVYLQWRSFRSTHTILGLLMTIYALTAAFFGNLFESPFGAVPFYLLVGFTAAEFVKREEIREDPAVAQLLPSTRW
jgi:hypothetical protein